MRWEDSELSKDVGETHLFRVTDGWWLLLPHPSENVKQQHNVILCQKLLTPQIGCTISMSTDSRAAEFVRLDDTRNTAPRQPNVFCFVLFCLIFYLYFLLVCQSSGVSMLVLFLWCQSARVKRYSKHACQSRVSTMLNSLCESRNRVRCRKAANLLHSICHRCQSTVSVTFCYPSFSTAVNALNALYFPFTVFFLLHNSRNQYWFYIGYNSVDRQ